MMSFRNEELRPILQQQDAIENGNDDEAESIGREGGLSASYGATDADGGQESDSTSADDAASTSLTDPNGENAEGTRNNNGSQPTTDGPPTNDLPEARDGTIGSLTRRLRCLFAAITWPIVPLGTLAAFALLWVLYTASSVDLRRTCSHPLHLYAVASLVLVAYIPQHAHVRAQLFNYSRERDGPIRPIRVRMYDQVFHTVCILYVYAGVSLIQTCHEDVVQTTPGMEDLNNDYSDTPFDASSGSSSSSSNTQASAPATNTCAATCPNLYQALSIYVAALEMFTMALILPLLFLPCIYLWFLRRATADAEAMSHLRGHFGGDSSSSSRANAVRTCEVLDSLEHVRFVHADSDAHDGREGATKIVTVETSYGSSEEGHGNSTSGATNYYDDDNGAKECCICMCEFEVDQECVAATSYNTDDDQSPTAQSRSLLGPLLGLPPPVLDERARADDKGAIVRTRCGHIFHKECLAGWVAGQWQLDPSMERQDGRSRSQILREQPARQTCCPLCREDMRSSTSSSV
eukprot:CAMPEP_0119554458 /NCGR_PEP_ID=MMETSP1352-20130426/6948_1 /TAXON_ID=265584 /ORGANISM="Stauroneis constricta, Strain CCMP1120" /LENGTH=519 /DNA_ID=CAMNT_0007601053 /DNA_START=86 /DNA_END=1645 /DNA_ORIENTATION=+